MGTSSSKSFTKFRRQTLKCANRSKEIFDSSPLDEIGKFEQKETFVTVADIESGLFATVKQKRSNGIREYIINNSNDCANISRIFESLNLHKDLKDSEDSIFLKITTTDSNFAKELEFINDATILFRKQAVVIMYEENNEMKSSIYFKLKDIERFFKVKNINVLDPVYQQMLNCFIADFLIDTFKHNNSGLYSNYNIQQDNNSIELNFLADDHDRNLLFIAAKQGNSEIVRILLKLGMNTIQSNNEENVQDIALEMNHYDVIFELAQANLVYPKNINLKNCTGKLKEFYGKVENLIKIIKDNNKEEARNILDQFPDQRYFYSLSNQSALKIAVLNGSIEIYEYFLSRNLMFGPHERPEIYFQRLSHDKKRIVREIHNKYTKHSPEKHLNILVANSFICHGVASIHDKIEYVQNAYETLNSNSLIRIILMIVAASKNFKIIFDFNHESVAAADPTVDAYTQGLFYPMGRIYIGAKQLLNESTKCETLANLAHELCHFAINLVYKNDAKPYRYNEYETAQEFEKINKICQEKSGKDDIIDTVYECYPQRFHHAELIVRVVHFIAYFQHQPDRLKEVQKHFQDLFNFYEKKIVPELENSLPEIESRIEKETRKNIKKISKFRNLLIIFIILAIEGFLAAIFIGIYTHTEIDDVTNVEDDTPSQSNSFLDRFASFFKNLMKAIKMIIIRKLKHKRN